MYKRQELERIYVTLRTTQQRTIQAEETWLAAEAAMAPGAVSYTHLRAHETPEHLVCRLLLEKKNKVFNRVMT